MLQVRPFKDFGDYSETDLPFAALAPRVRAALAKIHAADPTFDRSFSIVSSDKSLAHCLLYVDRQKELQRINGIGGPATFWVTGQCEVENRQEVFKLAILQLKKILTENPSAAISFVDYFSNGFLTSPASYLMQQYDCTASLSFFSVIDLMLSPEILRHGLRDSYKSLINRGLKEYTIICIAGEDVRPCHIESLHQCHITASARDVYPDTFWNIWLDECRARAAYLVLALKDGAAKGAILCTCAQECVYYAIGAFDRNLEKTGLSHACLWSAILHARQSGVRQFEVGRTDFDCLHPDVSAKEKSIGFFKRGFGGSNRPALHLSAKSRSL